MPFRTKLTEKLAIEQPVILAPMNAFSGGALAGAGSPTGAASPPRWRWMPTAC